MASDTSLSVPALALRLRNSNSRVWAINIGSIVCLTGSNINPANMGSGNHIGAVGEPTEKQSQENDATHTKYDLPTNATQKLARLVRK